MNQFHLIRKNLERKKLRSLFTLGSVTIAFLLFTLLGALDRAFSFGIEIAGADRLVTTHRVAFTQFMPYAYVNRVRGLDAVAEAAHQSWFGAYYQDPRDQIAIFATELADYRRVYPELEIDPDQWEALLANRTGLLLGRDLADSLGVAVGDRLPLQSTIWPRPDGTRSWDFVVEAVYDAEGSNEGQGFMHYDYFNETLKLDLIGLIVSKVADPDAAEETRSAIDALFRNSSTETKTSSEEGWIAGFAAQVGNIGLIVRSVLGCVFFTLLLVAGNTMAQAVRERTSELAVLKTIGFGNGRILWMVLGESLAIAVLGGVLGLVLGVAFVQGAAPSVAAFLPGLSVAPGWLGLGAVLAVVLGLVTGILPGLRAVRLKVVDALAKA